MIGRETDEQASPAEDPPRDLSAGPFELHDQAGDTVDFRFSLFRNGEVATLLNVALIPHNWRKEKEFAAFIVKAVNNHEVLVTALERIAAPTYGTELTDTDEERANTFWSQITTFQIIAKAALAKLSEGLPTPQPEGTSHATKSSVHQE